MSIVGVREIAAAAWTVGRGRLGRYAGTAAGSTDRFERELAALTGARHALAVNSGTNALVCALAALHVGPGDEVLVPAYTWVSTAAAVVVVGAVPVLVDVDETLTIDPADVRKKITPRTRAIIPVHMLNQVSDLDALMEIAREHGLLVVEDACQALGVTYRGRRVGTIGDAGAFSFNQHKNISSGEGGAVITDAERTFVRAAMMHDVGNYIRPNQIEHDEVPFVGFNMRMPEMSSAVLRPQLARLDRQLAKRRRRRAMIVEQLAAYGDRLRVSPHHDEPSAVGLTVMFDDPAEAARFGQSRGVHRLSDTGRHIYTNWQPILQRRTFDGRVNPWAGSDVEYAPDSCERTLDILARTCNVSVNPDLPMPVLRVLSRRMAESGRQNG